MGKGFETFVQDFEGRSSRAECQRFYNHCSRTAKKNLNAYLEWRNLHQLDASNDSKPLEENNDTLDWQHAVSNAISYTRQGGKRTKSMTATTTTTTVDTSRLRHYSKSDSSEATVATESTTLSDDISLPQVVFSPSDGDDNNSYLCCKDGCRVLSLYPARLNLDAPQADVLYSTILALYLDCKLNRENNDRLTAVIDVRPGKGWPNPPADRMIGFIRLLVADLQQLYPQRLHKCIFLPVPRPATWIWMAVKPFLGSSLRQSVVLLSGTAALKSPLPVEALAGHLNSVKHAAILERVRTDAFNNVDDRKAKESMMEEDSGVEWELVEK